jgi:tape measure domain-containing protein
MSSSFAKRAIAGIAIGSVVTRAISESMDLETAIVQFKVLLGDQQKAVALMEELRSFAATTPFQLGDIANSTKLLLNAGIAAEDMTDTLRMLGDLAAVGGKNLGDIAFVFAQVRAAGVLMGQDLNQLLNANIPAIKALAEEFGVAEGEVKKLVSTGAVTFERLESAMKRLTAEGGQANGATKALSETSAGLWSTLKDNVIAALAEFGEIITRCACWVG